MSNVVSFELLQKRDNLYEEIRQVQEEIELLNLILKRLRSQYIEISNKINKDLQATKHIIADAG